MDRFELLIRKHDVDLRFKPLYFDVSLTVWEGHPPKLSVCTGLSYEVAVYGIAIMLGVLELGWPGEQFRFRFPLPMDNPQQKRRISWQARDFRLPRKWAEAYLVPDHLIAMVARGEIDAYQLCHEERILFDVFRRRVERLKAEHRGVLPFIAEAF